VELLPLSISLIVPSRGRPQILMRMLSSVFKTVTHKEAVETVVLLDEDDQESLGLQFQNEKIVRLIGGKMSMGERVLHCLQVATGEILVLVNDDVIMRTKGWDEIIRTSVNSFPDGIYLLYPDDGFKSQSVATFPIFSRSSFDSGLLEGIQAFQGSFLDLHLLEVFQRIKQKGYNRIRYLDEILFEHMHYRLGKASWDATYAQRNRFIDGPVFADHSANRRLVAENLVQKIIGNSNPKTLDVILEQKSKTCLGYVFELFFDSGLPFKKRMARALWFFCHQKIGPAITFFTRLIVKLLHK